TRLRPEKRPLTLLVREHLLVVMVNAFGLDEAPGELPAVLSGQLFARFECRASALQPSVALQHGFGRHIEVSFVEVVGCAKAERERRGQIALESRVVR